MKKIILVAFILIALLSCKKKHFSPEGPTDVRIRNLSDLTISEVVVSTSENAGDTISFGSITSGSESAYSRFKKAYPKAEISANINIGGTMVRFSTGPVDYTYMQYIGQDRITYEVYIYNLANHVLSISNVIIEEPLTLK
jgi:hypothetical protein